MITKNTFIFCIILSNSFTSVVAMQPQLKSLLTTTLNPKTRQPLEKITIHNREHTPATVLDVCENYDMNSEFYTTTIEKYTHDEKTMYHLVSTNKSMNPLLLTEEDVQRILQKADSQEEKKVLFAVKNFSQTVCKIQVTQKTCQAALIAEPIELQPQKKISKKPQKVCVDQQENVRQTPIIFHHPPIDIDQPFRPPFPGSSFPTNNPIDEDNSLQNILNLHPTANRKEDQENLEMLCKIYKKTPSKAEVVNTLIDEQNCKAKKAYFLALADPMLKIIESINKKSDIEEKPEDLLPPKQKEVNNLAAAIVCHYWQTIQDNEHLDCSTFEKYANELKNAIRINDRDRTGLGKTITTAQEIICEAEKIIKQVNDTNKSYNEVTKKLNAKLNNDQTTETFNTQVTHEAKKVIRDSLLAAPIQVAAGTISKEMGIFGAYLILDYFDNPKATIEKNKIEKKKIKIEEKLKKAQESEKNAEQQYKKKLLKKATKSKNVLDSMNPKKLTQNELLQKIEDLNAKH